MVTGIKRDCRWYDWGRTAPRAYGAFCELKKECLREGFCNNCTDYDNSDREESKKS